MFYFFQGVRLLGGLALFLFGMETMSSALQQQAGDRLRGILSNISGTALKGFALGAAVTAVIQSSSATTVMTVGFVNSGILSLEQAAGVIIGSNVGTTATAWLLSLSGLQGDSFLVRLLKPQVLASLCGLAGMLLHLTGSRRKALGTALLGFLTLMTGMELMSGSMAFLEEEPRFARLMLSFTHPVLGILFGAVLTAVIQSSSASIGILQSLCVTGAVTAGAAVPIILGQNIGTCVTAVLGAIGANRSAKQAAAVHLLFNVLGAVLFCGVFYTVAAFSRRELTALPLAPWEISAIHTCFNLTATAVLLPMRKLLVRLARRLVPER